MKASSMVIHPGGCLCGAVRFEASGPSHHVVYCHCFFCRRQTGAPVAAFAGFHVSDGFRWLKGKPSVYRSSPAVRRKFCRRCGTPLTFEADHYPDRIDIGISAFDRPELLPPQAHDFWIGRIPWFDTMDGLPRHDGGGVPTAAGD